MLRHGFFGGDDERAVRNFVDTAPSMFLGFDDAGPATERWCAAREALEVDVDARFPVGTRGEYKKPVPRRATGFTRPRAGFRKTGSPLRKGRPWIRPESR
jgi:hypothetical protein